MWAYFKVNMVCKSHHETITAVIANKICSFIAAPCSPFDDFNKNTTAPILAIEAAITNRNKNVRLESCNFAILRTSRGCDDRMMAQSNTMIVMAKLIHINNIVAGTENLPLIKKNVIAL